MHTIVTISLLLLPLAASAGAQEATTFGFDDATLDAMPPPASTYADLVGGSLAIEGSTVRATLELAALPEMQPGVAYVFTFSNGTQEFWAGIATAPEIGYYYGEWISTDDGPDSAHETTGTYSMGAPGVISIEFPLAFLDGSTRLSSPGGATADIKGGAPPVGVLPQFIVFDTAQGEGDLELPPQDDPPSAAATNATPAEEVAPASGPSSGAPAPSQAPAEGDARVPGPGAFVSIVALIAAISVRGRGLRR